MPVLASNGSHGGGYRSVHQYKKDNIEQINEVNSNKEGSGQNSKKSSNELKLENSQQAKGE